MAACPAQIRIRMPGSVFRCPSRGSRRWECREASLDSFPPEFQQGMAARATELGDVGDSAPARWDPPFGSPDVHVALSRACTRRGTTGKLPCRGPGRMRTRRCQASRCWPCNRCGSCPQAHVLRLQGRHQLSTNRRQRHSGSNPQEPPLKAGEFILGYVDETGNLPSMPQPDVLGRNGTYLAIRKLHTRVAAAWRQYLRANATSPCRRGAVSGQDGRTLAERRAAGPLSRAG